MGKLTFRYITSFLSFTASMTSDSNGIFRVLPKLYSLFPVRRTKLLSVKKPTVQGNAINCHRVADKES